MKIPSSHLREFSSFQRILFFVKDGRTKVRSTLLLFKKKMLFLTSISSLDAAPPQVFVLAKDQKIIYADMK